MSRYWICYIISCANRVYFYEQSLKQAESGESAQLKLKQEDEEHARLMEENRLENEKTAKEREERWTVEAEKTRERVISSLVKKEQQEELYKSKLGEFIEMQKVIIQSNFQLKLEINLFVFIPSVNPYHLKRKH